MKNLTKILAAILITLNVSVANQNFPKVTISNIVYTSPNSLEFDIYLTCEDVKNEFKYSFGQYYFEFNPEISNGGELTYTLIKSGLPEELRPRNASVSGNLLRLAVNGPASNRADLPIVKSDGLLIARMRLETSSDKFSNLELDLKHSDGKFKTKVFSFVDNKSIEIPLAEDGIQNTIQTGNENQLASTVPNSFSLYQNYPNPFNPETKIKFDIPAVSGSASFDVKLFAYDISGRMIASLVNERLNPGSYEVKFNGNQLASGVYFYTLTAGEFSQTVRMVLIK